jgi:glyoxylase-like metal-dependent hydrolase (beta-lactamase superfamily II)
MQGVFQALLPRLPPASRLIPGAAALLCCGLILAADGAAAPRLRPLGAGVYAFLGAPEAAAPGNAGMVANQGVIVGYAGQVVVGTGGSDAHGERLLDAIRHLGGNPVVLAIDTHAAPENVLGNSAFARRGIPVLAHRETDRYMVRNCETCLRTLTAASGATAMAGSRLERPSRLVDGSTSLEVAGRALEILHFGTTQQAGAIAVFDRASGVLFAGGLASFDVIPDAHDADIAAWLAALRELRRLPLRLVLPGRGPPGPPERLDEVADYLDSLARETARAYRSGAGLRETTQRLRLPRFEAWALHDTVHRRNVQREYLRLEAEELAR